MTPLLPDNMDQPGASTAMPCIRCGACDRVCPARLLPQQLLSDLRAENLQRAVQHGLLHCIDCGYCDQVCPSFIPLLQQLGDAKHRIGLKTREQQRAQTARARFEARSARLELEAAERASPKQQTTSAAVSAALERAKAKRDASMGHKP